MSLSPDEEIARLRERQYEIVRAAQVLRDNCESQDAGQIRQIEQRALARLQAGEEQLRTLAHKARRNDRLSRIEGKVDLIGERQAAQYEFAPKPQRYVESTRPLVVREIIDHLVLLNGSQAGNTSQRFYKLVKYYDKLGKLPKYTEKDLNTWRAAAYRAIRDNAVGLYVGPFPPHRRIVDVDVVERVVGR